MPTLLVFTTSPADRAAPQKLAYQEIAGSAGDTERPAIGPGVERARIRPLAVLPSPSVRVMGLAALCPAHISAIGAQSCTNEKSPSVPRPRITITNHDYLEGIGFEPQNRPNPCASETPPARDQTAPPKTRILRPNREFVFSAAPQDRFSRAAPPIRVYSRIRVRNVFRDPRPGTQECTNLKPLPLAAPRITKPDRPPVEPNAQPKITPGEPPQEAAYPTENRVQATSKAQSGACPFACQDRSRRVSLTACLVRETAAEPNSIAMPPAQPDLCVRLRLECLARASADLPLLCRVPHSGRDAGHPLTGVTE